MSLASTSLVSNHTGNAGMGDLGNTAGAGGAMFAYGGSLSATLAVIDSNRSGTADVSGALGGALFFYTTTVHISQSSITRNIAGGGAGVVAFSSGLTLRNVTLSGNVAQSGAGGGLYVVSGTSQLDFVTLTANQATVDGGVYLAYSGPTAPVANVSVRNSIVSGNIASSPGDCEIDAGAGAINSLGYNLAGDGCPAISSTDIATTNPRLGPLSDNGGVGLTHVPSPTSPATDAANCAASSGITTDQRGHARFVDIPRVPNAADACDIGAIELDDDIFWNGFD